MSVKRARSRGSAMTAKNVRSWDCVKYRGRRWWKLGIEAKGVMLRPPTTSSRLHVLSKACSDAPGCRGWPGSGRFERLGALPRPRRDCTSYRKRAVTRRGAADGRDRGALSGSEPSRVSSAGAHERSGGRGRWADRSRKSRQGTLDCTLSINGAVASDSLKDSTTSGEQQLARSKATTGWLVNASVRQ